MTKLITGLWLASYLIGASCYAKEIRLAVGLALPPYYLSDQQSGLELEIIKQALQYRGHTLTPVFVPFARLIKSIESGFVDAAAPANEGSGYAKGFYSDSHIAYQNIAVTLKSSHLEIDGVSALAGHSIIAFQSATSYLTPEYAQLMEQNPRYAEKSRQDLQISMLVSKRTEIIILDQRIFKYYAINQGVDYQALMNMHFIFDPVAYKVIFNDEGLRDDFNAGLAQIKASGEYKRIVENYIGHETLPLAAED